MKDSNKEFLIIFTDPHFVYSPTTLNLFYELKKHFTVNVIAPKDVTKFSDNLIEDENIKYISYEHKNSILKRIKNKLRTLTEHFIKPNKDEMLRRRLLSNQAKSIINEINNTNKEIIAVDFLALWCAQYVGKKAHLLSLEILEHDIYKSQIYTNTIKSVIIQSKERYNYLFPNASYKVFYIQNAPKYINFEPAYSKRKKTDLIYNGSAVLRFGIVSLLDFLNDYPEYTLTIKGAVAKDTMEVISMFYKNLLDENRLILDTEFLSQKDLTAFVSEFRIGFAFYDFFRFNQLRVFNYFTAPSGKAFQYLNSGVPVIGNNIEGFKFIKEQNAGILINYLSSKQIKNAIDSIEANYIQYAKSAKNTSKLFDFSKSVIPFIKYLKEEDEIHN